jgi:Zn-dependent protease
VKGLNGKIEFDTPSLDSMVFWRVGAIPNFNVLLLVHYLLDINIFWGLINLLPVYPLDGGQISRQLLISSDPYGGIRKSLWLSVIVGGVVAVVGWAYMNQPYLGVMFGMLAFSSYTMLQQMGGGRGGRW